MGIITGEEIGEKVPLFSLAKVRRKKYRISSSTASSELLSQVKFTGDHQSDSAIECEVRKKKDIHVFKSQQ